MRAVYIGWFVFFAAVAAGSNNSESASPPHQPSSNQAAPASSNTPQGSSDRDRMSSMPSEENKEQEIVMELMGKEEQSVKLGYGNCQWLGPYDAPQEKLADEPAYKSDKPIYYKATFGDAADNIFSFILDESQGPGKGYDLFYIDLNNDNRIDPETESVKIVIGNPAHSDSVRIALQVTTGGVTAPYYESLSAFTYKDERNPVEKIHANLRNSSYYGGEAVFEGINRKIAIADLDSNGLFNDTEKGIFHGDRFFIFFDDKAERQDDNLSPESFPYGQYTRIREKWFSIVVSPDGSRLKIAPAAPRLGKVEASPSIAGALIVSDVQSMTLKFKNNSDDALTGTYQVKEVKALPKNAAPSDRGLIGQFTKDPPSITVNEGGSTRLVAGPPFTAEVQSTPKADGMIEFCIAIRGVGGETYQWRQKNPSSPKAGFDLLDSSGKKIASEEFEYG